MTFTSSSDQITASVGVTSELIPGDIYFWGSLMAGAVLGSVPIVIPYVSFLDYYVSGLTGLAPSSSGGRPRAVAPSDQRERAARPASPAEGHRRRRRAGSPSWPH